jgi:hypothetical protein
MPNAVLPPDRPLQNRNGGQLSRAAPHTFELFELGQEVDLNERRSA